MEGEEDKAPRDSRPTRGTPVVVWPTKGDALSLQAGEYGNIITVYAAPNYNSKKMHGRRLSTRHNKVRRKLSHTTNRTTTTHAYNPHRQPDK